jgi:hypothetical protein
VLKRELAFNSGFHLDFYSTFLLFCSILALIEFLLILVILFPKLATKLPTFIEKNDDKNIEDFKDIDPRITTSFVPVGVIRNVKNKSDPI